MREMDEAQAYRLAEQALVADEDPSSRLRLYATYELGWVFLYDLPLDFAPPEERLTQALIVLRDPRSPRPVVFLPSSMRLEEALIRLEGYLRRRARSEGPGPWARLDEEGEREVERRLAKAERAGAELDAYADDLEALTPPPTVPCERCQAPLGPRGFFLCPACRLRLCESHRSGERCDRCA